MGPTIDENLRLATLDRYEILDTQPEPAFDSIVELTSEVFDVPVVVVSIVDENRSWFKAAKGVTIQEMPRNEGLCELALGSNGVFVIPDTSAHVEARSRGIVTQMGARFFAAAPLQTRDGVTLGSLCILDTQPRAFAEAEQQKLAGLGGLVMEQLELRNAVRRVARAAPDLREVSEAISLETGEAFLASLTCCLVRILEIDIAFVSEVDNGGAAVRHVNCTVCDRGEVVRDPEHVLEGTPCSTVLGQEPRVYAEGVRKLFPEDSLLADLGIEGYVGVPLFDSAGEPLGLVGAMDRKPIADADKILSLLRIFGARASAEIERVRMERALRRSRRRNAALLEALPDLIFRVDREGRFLDWETGSQAKQPYRPPEEFLGRRVTHVMPEGVGDLLLARVQAAFEQEQMQVVEYQLAEPEGTRDYEARIVVSGTDEAIAFVRDITPRREAERARRRMDRRLLESQKLESLGALAGRIAHKFNNLLCGILGHTDLVLKGLAPDAAQRQNLFDIDAAAQRANDLAQQLLAFSGRGRFQLRVRDVNTLVEEMRDVLELSVRSDAQVRLELASALHEVRADASQIRQAILNLVTNASEATSGGTIVIRTGKERVDRKALDAMAGGVEVEPGIYVYLEVEDDGAGMDAATVARIFEPFYTTRGPDRGLGLAAVMGVVRGHRGALAVDSEPGRGTRFRLLLPAVLEKPDVAPAGATRTRNGPILVVDDEEPVRSVLAHMLKSLGREALVVSNGRDALRLFRERSAELGAALVDLTMPGIRGTELCREFKKADPELHIVLMSGYDEDTATELREREDVAFLAKPFTVDDVQRLLAL